MPFHAHDLWLKSYFYPGYDNDHLSSATDVDVDNKTDIDVRNDVLAEQNTIVDADIGPYSSAIVDESLNAAPKQSGIVGNFDGEVETGETDVDVTSVIADGPFWGGYGYGYGFGGDSLTSLTDIDVTNSTDIDVTNNVAAVQNTVIDLDIGPGSSAIISESLNAAPQQNLAVGNFGGEVTTGETDIFVDDAIV